LSFCYAEVKLTDEEANQLMNEIQESREELNQVKNELKESKEESQELKTELEDVKNTYNEQKTYYEKQLEEETKREKTLMLIIVGEIIVGISMIGLVAVFLL
jgi:uncharacterized coiled-coil DUF342 family protein